MDFARKQLEKYGWTDGKGLGKNENGIAEPIKPKLKRSVAGIGHDAAADFTEFWWSQLYDKAAKNVEVKEKNGKTKKIKTKESEFKITNSTYQLSKSDTNAGEKEEYSDFFVKTIVLTSGGTQERLKEELQEKEEKKKDVFQLTEEELFAACEGRTAHKGARHGLRATGKLARIERQEKELLLQDKYTGYSHSKKIKKNKSDSELDLVQEGPNLIEYSDEISKNKKSNENNLATSEIDTVEQETNILEENERISKKKRNKSKCNVKSSENISGVPENDLVEENENTLEERIPKRKTSKSEKSNENDSEIDDVVVLEDANKLEEKISKKKKKKSKFNEKSSISISAASEFDIIEEDTNILEENDRISKKKKNKSKSKEKSSENNLKLDLVVENTNLSEESNKISKNKKKKVRCKENSNENNLNSELEIVVSKTDGLVEGITGNIDDSINLKVKKKKPVTEKEPSNTRTTKILENYSQENGGALEKEAISIFQEKKNKDILEDCEDNQETIINNKKDKKRKGIEIVQNDVDIKKSKKNEKECE